MAHHKSAKKRIRSNEKKRVENRYYAKTMRNALRDFRALEDKAVATEPVEAATGASQLNTQEEKEAAL